MLTTYLQKLHLFSRDVRLHLITATLIGLTMNGIWFVLFNLYLLRLGCMPKFIGLVHATSMLAFASFCLPAGVLGTRWGSRRMLIMAVAMLIVGNGLLPLVEFLPPTRGNFSSTNTLYPFAVSRAAAESPPIPEPTTTTS